MSARRGETETEYERYGGRRGPGGVRHTNDWHPSKGLWREQDLQRLRERYCAGLPLTYAESNAIRRDIPFLKDGMNSALWREWKNMVRLARLGEISEWRKNHPEYMERLEKRMDNLKEAYRPLVEAYRAYMENPDLADKHGMAAQYMPLLENPKNPGLVLSTLNALRKLYGHDELKIRVVDMDDPEKVRADFEELARRLGTEPEPRRLTSDEVVVRGSEG